MSPAVRRLALWVAAAAVAGSGVASIAAYRPGGVNERAVAFEDIKRALQALEATELDSAARLAAYRNELLRAELDLRQAIRVNPADTASIGRMAMVQWEASVLAGTPDSDSVRSLVGIAAARAPRVPEIQIDLGSLLYKMGSSSDATPFMRRAVELSPATTKRAVMTMLDAGIEPETIVRELPHSANVLIVLREDFARSGRLATWLTSAEELLPVSPHELLWPYTYACLGANAEPRLLEHIERLGVLPEHRAEAERQIAIGRAQLGLHEPRLAAMAAEKARASSPADPDILDFAGQIALAAGHYAAAEAAFHEALAAFALAGSNPTERARLYRQRGQALEALGRVEDAFDEYRRAVEILPTDPWLLQRLAQWSPKPRVEGHP